MTSPAPSRAEQKARTRRALLDAALGLHAERGLAGLPLREVARRGGIVPTAFYRHFSDTDELGRVLADEAVEVLRSVLADVDLLDAAALLDRLRTTAAAHRLLMLFLLAERTGTAPPVRPALTLLAAGLATRLARGPLPPGLSDDALSVVADQLLDAVLAVLATLLELPAQPEPRVLERVRLRLATAASALPPASARG